MNRCSQQLYMVAKKPQKPRSKPQAVPAGESQFRSLIETALDVVVVLNYDGTIRYSSPSVQRITGYSPEELLGENAFSYIHEDDTDQEFEVFNAVVTDPGRDIIFKGLGLLRLFPIALNHPRLRRLDVCQSCI